MGLRPTSWSRISPTATFDTGGMKLYLLNPDYGVLMNHYRFQYPRRNHFCQRSPVQLGEHRIKCVNEDQWLHRFGA